jgi:hypothetical protein
MRPSPDIDPELVRNGEYELSLWADLSALPADERRAIWGLMVGNEGRTRVAIYDYYNKAGFNPDKDMLQCPVMSPKPLAAAERTGSRAGRMTAVLESRYPEGIATDWNQMSSVGGLFAAGPSPARAAPGGSSGAYAGNRAAEYAMKAGQGRIDEAQVAAEKERVYALWRGWTPAGRYQLEGTLDGYEPRHAAGLQRIQDPRDMPSRPDVAGQH